MSELHYMDRLLVESPYLYLVIWAASLMVYVLAIVLYDSFRIWNERRRWKKK